MLSHDFDDSYGDYVTTLTVNGVGGMRNYSELHLNPWFDYANIITNMVIENGVTHIGRYASNHYFQNLTSVISLNDTPPTIEDFAFGDYYQLSACLYVPENSIDAYYGSDWVNYFGCIEPIASTSVLSPNRIVPPQTPKNDPAVSAPVSALTGELTAGPNPVAKSAGTVNFFWRGKGMENATLSIYNASGKLVKKIKLTDKTIGKSDRRIVGKWDLKDAKGRPVSEGTYIVKGTVKTKDGNKEKVSLVFGVR
jgi:hypothetical protein